MKKLLTVILCVLLTLIESGSVVLAESPEPKTLPSDTSFLEVKGFIKEELNNPTSTPYFTTFGVAGSKAWNWWYKSYGKNVDRAQRNLSKAITRYEKYGSKSVRYANKLQKARTRLAAQPLAKNSMMKYGVAKTGQALAAYSAYDKVKSYMDNKSKHSSVNFLVRCAKGVDIQVNIHDAAGGKSIPPWLSLLSGLTTDYFSSDDYAKACDSMDGWFIDGLDMTIDNMDDWWTKFFYQFFRPAEGVGVYKPNIYLYPKELTNVTIDFDCPALITTSIPEYRTSWNVIANKDGTLLSDDGNKYDFLFYECEIQPNIIVEDKAYLITCDNREEQLTNILESYGLNEREINDFNEFWLSKLDANVEYLAYELNTAEVDKIMPLNISPTSDSILRLWFAFKPYNGEEFVVPNPERIMREGFTLIEWGGLFLE